MPFFSDKTPEKAENLSQDADLVEKAIAGDAEAFGQLVEKYSSFVYRTVFFDIKKHEDAEDISQEVFIKAYRALGSFRCDCEFSTWLYRICKNTVYDYARKRVRNATIPLSSMSSDEYEREYEVPDTDGKFDPEKTYISKETSGIVNDAISSLSEQHRDIIVMRDIQGLSYSEIADILSLEEGTVKSRLSRARAALKQKLSGKNLL